MAASRVEDFLDLYKKLESLLSVFYTNNTGRYDSFVLRYENSEESGDKKDTITAIRKIRNLLQHNPKMNNHYVVEPSEEIVDALREIVQDLEQPKLAINFGVKAEKIYKATLSSGLMKVINVMKDRGFNTIPVIENNKVYGVISTHAIFEFVTEQGMQIITEETKVLHMKSYLPIDKHKNEYYLFLPKTTTLEDADEAFEKRDEKKRRLAAIFITEHGRDDEPLLAMLTPWSVVGK